MTPDKRAAVEADCSLAEDPNTGYIPSLMSSLATHCRTMLAENAELTAEVERLRAGLAVGIACMQAPNPLETERDQLKAEAIKATQMMDKATATLLQLDAERDLLRQRVAALEEALRKRATDTQPDDIELLAATTAHDEPSVAGLFCADHIEGPKPKEGE